MSAERLRYAKLDDKELAAELRKRMAEVKQVLTEVRDLLRGASNVE